MNIARVPRWIAVVATALCFAVSGGLWYHYYSIKKRIEVTALQTAGQEIDRATDRLSDYFISLQAIIQKTASYINDHTLTKEQLTKLLHETLQTQQNFEAVAVAYQPFAFDKNQRLFSLLLDKKGEKIEEIPIPYDYTQSSIDAGTPTDWYTKTITQGEQWAEPYFGKALKRQIITYAVPIYQAQGSKMQPIGVICATITPTLLNNIVNNLSTLNAGYGIIISKRGYYVVHPNDSYTKLNKSILQVAQEQHNESLKRITPIILSTPAGTLFYNESMTMTYAALLYRAVGNTNLILASIIPYAELLNIFGEEFRKIALLIIFFITMALMGTVIIVMPLFFTRQILLTTCIGISLVLTLGIIGLCTNERKTLHTESQTGTPITRKTIIDKLANEISAQTGETIIQIKTGLLINNIEFVSSGNVRLTGYVWQYYPATVAKNIIRDVLFGDCTSSCTKKELAHETRDGTEFILWFFTGTFNQIHFSLRNYPLDEQTIFLALSRPAPIYDLFLVPDLDAYKLLAPRDLPGLTSDIKISDRILTESFFLFKKTTDTLNWQTFYEKITPQQTRYRLNFQIISLRNLSHAIVLYLLPILIALIFLNISLVLVARNKKFFLNSISIASSIFLTMSLIHSTLRKDVGITGICYLEYYFIFLYLIICIVLLDILFYGKNTLIARVITHQNNRWAIALMMPFYLFAMNIISLLNFYN